MDAGNLLQKASDNFSVRRAFGAAYEKDGTLIIPVALVAGGGGGGRSRTVASAPAATDQEATDQDATDQDATDQDVTAQDSRRADVGGGMGGMVLPAGVYVVKGDQVRWVPAVDVTIITLASLCAVRVLAGALRRSGRRAPRRR
ncbi:MAG TPA: spore germination protein GerW family protein [Trebonia sp.]|nr:spore germination protein GerW family protein [Trebonia sp.]